MFLSFQRLFTVSLFLVVLMSAGCAKAPQPYIADFTDDKVHVSVHFDIFGPSADAAKASSLPVAVEQCDSYEKGAELVSSFRQSGRTYYEGNFVFLYRCVGADTVRIEDSE